MENNIFILYQMVENAGYGYDEQMISAHAHHVDAIITADNYARKHNCVITERNIDHIRGRAVLYLNGYYDPIGARTGKTHEYLVIREEPLYHYPLQEDDL